MEGIECDHGDHAEASTLLQTLTQRLRCKDFLVDLAKYLVDAGYGMVDLARAAAKAAAFCFSVSGLDRPSGRGSGTLEGRARRRGLRRSMARSLVPRRRIAATGFCRSIDAIG